MNYFFRDRGNPVSICVDVFIEEIGQSEGSYAGRVEYRCESKWLEGGERRRASGVVSALSPHTRLVFR